MAAMLRIGAHTSLFLERIRQPAVRKPIWPSLARGLVVGVGLCLAVSLGSIFFDGNRHEVLPGRVWRSAQLSSTRLESTIQRHGIRTVVNLRGYCPGFGWYEDESRTTHRLAVAQEDICLSAIRYPSPGELRELILVLDRCEYPILVHCRQGVDRTGLVSALAQLLQPGSSLEASRRQLSVGFGYVPFNGTEAMDQFFEFYESWLRVNSLNHSPELLRHWARHEYRPGACSGEITALAGFPADGRLHANRFQSVKVLLRNTSVATWRFSPGTMSGVHVKYQIINGHGVPLFSETAGRFDAVVAPGEAMPLTLRLPRMGPGRYVLQAELIENDRTSFSQFGVEPFTWGFEVVENGV